MRLIKIPDLEPTASGPRDPDVTLDTIVIHYTATADLGRYSTDMAWNLKRIQRALDNGGISPEVAAALRQRYSDGRPMSDAVALCLISASNQVSPSWNYCVASRPEPGQSECEVVEFVDPKLQAHHIGAIGGRTNQRSVGIENVNPGWLPGNLSKEEATARYAKKGWPEPFKARALDGALYWFTPPSREQYNALIQVCRQLRERFPAIQHIEGHHRYAPTRRIDPDPPFSLEQIRKDVFAASWRPPGKLAWSAAALAAAVLAGPAAARALSALL